MAIAPVPTVNRLPVSLLVILTATVGCASEEEPGWLPGGSAGETGATDDDDDDDPPTDDEDDPPADDDENPPPDDEDPPPSTASETEPSGESGDDTTGGPTETGGTTAGIDESSSTGEPVDPPAFDPLYRIDVRIHRGNSGLTDDELRGYLVEMNQIWRQQAAVCFEFEIVEHDDTMSTGFDMWFQPEVGGPNGYYAGDHDVWVRDFPSLGSAPNPVEYGGARTAAHELGHGLTLDHDQSSDDYLMRSGTEGFEIPDYQITASRSRAAEKALEDTTPLDCATPTIP